MLNPVAEFDKKIADAEKESQEAKKRLSELRHQRPREVVTDYSLMKLDGSSIKLSELFGPSIDLMIVHNMGQSCDYCTLWADGFNGVADHLKNRCTYALVSNDEPEKASKFASSRGWKFDVLSGHDSEFTLDMGFADPKNRSPWPGVSTFKKEEDGTIVRTGTAPFGPGDDFCGVWHLFDLLDGGAGDWAPKKKY